MNDEIMKNILDLGSMAKLQLPDDLMPRVPLSHSNPAAWAHERLTKQIIKFEASLAPDEEVGGRLVSAPGPDGFFHIEDIGYWGPDMIIFYGSNGDGRTVQLLQHHTQLNVLLVALPVKQGAEARRIGFHLQKEAEKS